MHLSLPPFDLFDALGISSATAATWISRILGLIVVWIIVWVLVRYLSRWLERLDEGIKHFDVSSRDMRTLDRLLDYSIILIGATASLAILGWTSLLYSALTAAGVFSVIIGFAIKDVAANFVSGVFILIDQPFAPGDSIEVGSYSGTVKSISLRATTLVSVDGPLVYIPNSVLAAQPTTNYSVARVRRINFTVSIASDADIQQALESVKGVLASAEGLLAEQPQSVLVDNVRDHAVDIGVICYAPNDTWLALASAMKQQVVNALQQSEIELAVPIHKTVTLTP